MSPGSSSLLANQPSLCPLCPGRTPNMFCLLSDPLQTNYHQPRRAKGSAPNHCAWGCEIWATLLRYQVQSLKKVLTGLEFFHILSYYIHKLQCILMGFYVASQQKVVHNFKVVGKLKMWLSIVVSTLLPLNKIWSTVHHAPKKAILTRVVKRNFCRLKWSN